VIYAERELSHERVAKNVVSWGKAQSQRRALSWSNKIDDREKFQKAAKQAVEEVWKHRRRQDADMLTALASDVVHDGDKLARTAFDLTSGNQQFLKSLREVGGTTDKALTAAAVHEALIGPWRYRDKEHSLGWDPNTQRLHALRGKLPERDKENRSVRAAVFLASQALPLFPCFAAARRLKTTGFYYVDGENWFAWPVWNRPITIDTLRSLLAQPFAGHLRARGVQVVYRSRVSHTGGAEGNYQVFSHPEEWPWQEAV
jgi:hypothetical protein